MKNGETTSDANRLPNCFYAFPHLASEAIHKKDLERILLATDGIIIANGRYWHIISEQVSGDIYRVSLRRIRGN